MVARSLRVSPFLFFIIILCGFVGWNIRRRPALVPAHSHDEAASAGKLPKSPRIAIATFTTEERSYTHLSLKNKDHYARRHGYDFIVDYEAHTDRGVTYWKFNMMERLMATKKYDWIWWIDFDTLITNTDVKLTDIITESLHNVTNPENVDWLTTHDCNGLNTGSFIVRGHKRSIKFLHDLYAITDDPKQNKDQSMSEQDGMVKLIASDKVSASRTKQVPQWKLNAFPTDIPCVDDFDRAWEPGMFVVHFAGAWAHVQGQDATGQLMKKYEGDIIWGEWEKFY